ncbi:AI-2E family transporter [Propionicicella superfundia]|uniref:AI-2E family transporter n=1 Tax=Propionicicella superfundia TaxID=348582 RepID=UPI0004284C3C|nr:AI-2E family transporter [Propionicicella superfundia]
MANDNDPTLANDFTPPALRIAAGWAWRLLLVAALAGGIVWLIRYFSTVTIPLAVAILLTALLTPLHRWLQRRKVHRVASTLVCLLVLVLVVGGVLTLLGAQIASEAPSLSENAIAGVQQLLAWLSDGPLQVNDEMIQGWTTQLTTALQDAAGSIAGVVASAGASVGHFLAGAAIAILTTFFFLLEGERIWSFVVSLVPGPARARTRHAAGDGWISLVAYMRAQVVVCLVDATGVLIAALLLQVPLPWALFGLTFVASFVPILGAFVAGAVAVLLALVAHGWVTALIMLGAVILVMQLESHFLQPILLGKAVDIHPLGVLLGIAAGSVVAGLVGALMAIPVVAFSVAFARSLRHPEQSFGLGDDGRPPERGTTLREP